MPAHLSWAFVCAYRAPWLLVQGSPLVAACGAPLCVAVCNAADGVPVTVAELPPGAQLEVRVGHKESTPGG